MTEETGRYLNYNTHFPGGDFDKIKEVIIGKQITSIEQKGTFKAVVTLDDGAILQLEGNEGCCCCGSGDWSIRNLLANMAKPKARIMNAWIDNQIKVGEVDGDLQGPITVFIMAEGREYPLVEFNGYDTGCYGHGFYCRVTRIIPPEN